jgi:hypothetical protein
MTMEKVLVNAAEISSISGFPLVSPQSSYGQVVSLSQKHNMTACDHILSNRPFAVNLKFGSSNATLLKHNHFPMDPTN